MEAGGEEDGEQLTPGQAGGGQVDGGEAGEAVGQQLAGDGVSVHVGPGELQLLDLVAPDDLGEDGGEMAGAKTSVPEVEMSDSQDR